MNTAKLAMDLHTGSLAPTRDPATRAVQAFRPLPRGRRDEMPAADRGPFSRRPDSFDRQPCILVAIDLSPLAHRLSGMLGAQGYRAIALQGKDCTWAQIRAYHWDALIVDQGLVAVNGLGCLYRVRAHTRSAIIVLSDDDDIDFRIAVIDSGADACLARSAPVRELQARLRNLLGRAYRSSTSGRFISCGLISIDLRTRSAWLDQRRLTLTACEFALLEMLVRHKGQALSKAQLLGAISDRRYGPADRAVDVHLSHIRLKLGDSPRCPRYIETVRGRGYVCVELDRADKPHSQAAVRQCI